jgi:hypothetical protein
MLKQLTRFNLTLPVVTSRPEELCETDEGRANLTTFYHNGPLRRGVTASAVLHLVQQRPALTELRVADTALGPAGLAEAVGCCPGLRALALPRTVGPQAVRDCIPALPEVEYLSIKGIPLRVLCVPGGG